MATQSVAQNITTNGDTQMAPTVVEGQYLLAVGSENFDGAQIEILANVGIARSVPLDLTFTAPGSRIIWLPRCSLVVRTTSAGPSTEIDVALAELSSQMHRFN